MPRFLSMIRVDEQNPPDLSAHPEFPERMGALFEENTNAGVMLDTAGLTPTSEGTRVTWTSGRLSYNDGPFTETKEVVGGYAILQAKDKALGKDAKATAADIADGMKSGKLQAPPTGTAMYSLSGKTEASARGMWVVLVPNMTAEATGLRENHAVRAAFRNLHLRRDRVRTVLRVDEHVFAHAGHALEHRERSAAGHQIGSAHEGRVQPFEHAVVER